MSKQRDESKIYIFRGLPFGTDARIERFSPLFPGYCVRYITWGSHALNVPNLTTIPLGRPKGHHLLMSLLYPLVSLWIAIYVLFKAKYYDVCIFIDLECSVFAVFACRIKRIRCIFDIADPFYLTKPVPFPARFAQLEEFVTNHASITTLPHSLRIDLYPYRLRNSRTFVIENVPKSGKLATQDTSDLAISPIRKPNTKWVMGYFGQLEAKYRGIEDLINLTIQTPDMEFWVAGVGELRSLILEVEKYCDRVKFLGPYSQDNLPALTSDVDIYAGLYYSEKRLHKYAVPNKYYEHLYLGIPILTSAQTPFARGIKGNRTGWAIEDGPMAMIEWFGNLNKDDSVKMRANCQEQWRKEYENYYGRLKFEFDKIWPSIK